MTRSAEQAIDEAQAKLGERCERLLASSAWNKAHTSTHQGLLKPLPHLREGVGFLGLQSDVSI